MLKRCFVIIMASFAIIFSQEAFAKKTADDKLIELLNEGPKKGKSVTEELNKIWMYSHKKEVFHCDPDYQISMINHSFEIANKYKVESSVNFLFLCSFRALKYLVDRIYELDHNDAVLCSAAIAVHYNSKSGDPIRTYFSKEAVKIWLSMKPEEKIGKDNTFVLSSLIRAVMCTPYEGAEQDLWEIIKQCPEKCLPEMETFAAAFWNVRYELSKEQVIYLCNIFSEYDNEKVYKMDYIFLVAKDKDSAKEEFNKRGLELKKTQLRDIQSSIEDFIRVNCIEVDY